MKILIVATSAGDDKLGCWAEELMAPYLAFKEKGAEVTIASIKGGKIPLDPASLNAPFKTPDVEKFMADASLMALVNDSVAFDTVDESSYDALFLPGGHGIVFDGPGNSKLADTIGKMFTAGKVVSAVCHGPAGLVDAKNAEGKSIIAGKKVTGFSNTEEAAVDKTSFVPFLLEDKMKELGGSYSKAEADWGAHVVRDGNLVTGQNPGSSVPLAKVVLEAIAA